MNDQLKQKLEEASRHYDYQSFPPSDAERKMFIAGAQWLYNNAGFWKIRTSDRKPPVDTPVIAGWDTPPDTVTVVTISENGYWWLSGECGDCDEPDWWMEERSKQQ